MPNRSNRGRTGRTIDAVETSCRIVDLLDERGTAGVSELARELDRSKSTIHSHLRTLEQCGYVVREGNGYRPSLRFLDISENLRENHLDIYRSSREVLQNLAEETEEYAWLMVEENGKGVFINSARGSEAAITTNIRLGKPYHLHGLSSGKAILAALPRERVIEIIDKHGLPQFTEGTITDRDRLLETLDCIEEQGVAFSQGETTVGIKAIGAPIYGVDGGILGAVSISGPESRMGGEWYEETAPELVLNAANLIEIHTAYE